MQAGKTKSEENPSLVDRNIEIEIANKGHL